MSFKAKKSKIFADSDSEEDDAGASKGLSRNQGTSQTQSQLTFNKSYAERYNQWRGKEELQKLKDRYGPDVETAIAEGSESESSSSDDDDEDWGPEQEKQFLKTLSSLKAKNPKIYDQKELFFNKEAKAAEAEGLEGKKDKKDKDKPFLLKDHERQMILENQGLEPEDTKITSKKSYFEELKDIKTEFSSALQNVDSDAEDDNSDLLKKRVKSTQQTADEEEAYRKWLKGELEKLDDESQTGKKDAEELKFLHDYWTDPKLEDGETFLRDYILNRKYIEKEAEDKHKIPSYDEIVHDSDEGGLSGDEQQLEQMETFENKYNFRFEEPDQEFIKKYPRTIEETYRRKESKRKTEREKHKERKQAEKERKLAELNQLKALKRKEIMDKLNKLSEITGTSDLPFEDKDLEEDFDPDEYDKRMNKIFSENYYEEEDGEKPEFPYDEEIDGGDVEDIEPWVPPTESDEDEESSSKKSKKKNKKKPHNTEEIPEETPLISKKHSNYQDELIESSKGRRKSKKKSLFLQKLERQKPAFDPTTHESYQKYFDEYYKLDFEDLIGDIPCRFKYRNVVPNDFGLSTEEILAAPDTELNQWASLKKTFTHRPTEEEKYEVQAYSKRAGDLKAKKKKIPTLYASPKDDDEDEDEKPAVEAAESSVAKKKRKKRKKKKTSIEEGNEVVESTEVEATTEPAKTSKKKKKKQAAANGDHEDPQPPTISITKESKKSRKRKHSKANNSTANSSVKKPLVGVDDDRLRAYGINPSQYKKRMKYGV